MTTELKIFNVRHGFCAALISENNLILIDCGHDGEKFRPLQWLYSRGHRHIDAMVISNLDQDHVSDIKAVRGYFTVGSLVVNPTIDADTLRRIKVKGGRISDQMQIVINTLANTDLADVRRFPHRVNDTSLEFYCVYYPHETDTNNLSLVTFLEFGTSYIIYPGDLETRGWAKLLTVPQFIEKLRCVNVFIASHHGRVNGYYEDVFRYCQPEVVLISDKERTFTTQDHDRYSKHASGVNFGTLLAPKTRKVMTTRNDGHLTLYKIGETTYVKGGL